ncbi:MAG TPA: 50S ribosomal protein L30 [Salinivirgaceae bacterium]|nr:50S ribosomal protein L30 [Salinivirgaceae bacterium]
MGKLVIKQVRSSIDQPRKQKDTLKALGLRKMNQTVIHEATPQIRGMVEKVKHLVIISETNE